MNIPADIHARVVELTDRIIDAGQSGAADAAEAGYDELRRYCESLAAAGRDHPFLWETLADFTGDDRLAIALYLRALPLATAAGAASYAASICLALAERLQPGRTRRRPRLRAPGRRLRPHHRRPAAAAGDQPVPARPLAGGGHALSGRDGHVQSRRYG